MGPFNYDIMVSAMRSFGFGIVGSQQKMDLMYAAMPNKLFEYIHCGVVPLIFNMGEASQYVKDHQIGLDMTELAGAPDRGISMDSLIEQGMEFRKKILAIREGLFMEDNIAPLIKLYHSL